MNIENLQHINKNDTSNSILRLLSKSREISNETNLDSFRLFLVKRAYPIQSNDFIEFFKNLENAHIGYFVKNTNRFVWKYSVKAICEQILEPNKKVDLFPLENKQTEKEEINMPEVKRKRGRPPGAPNKPKILSFDTKVNQRQEPIKKPQITHRATSDVVMVFTSTKGQVIPLSLEDADRLVSQVRQIKEHLALS